MSRHAGRTADTKDRQRTYVPADLYGRTLRLVHPRANMAWFVYGPNPNGLIVVRSVNETTERHTIAWPLLRLYLQQGHLVIE